MSMSNVRKGPSLLGTTHLGTMQVAPPQVCFEPKAAPYSPRAARSAGGPKDLS